MGKAGILITIDGPAGSGKTTLASEIASLIEREQKSVNQIHMDSLYNGWDGALTNGMRTRMRNEILPEIVKGENFQLPSYDWLIDQWGEPQSFHTADFTILEGVGAGQKVSRPFASLSSWIEVSAELAMERVLERDGFHLEPQMKRWQKLEREHFTEEATKLAADYQLVGAP